jgi:hypothetical protein
MQKRKLEKSELRPGRRFSRFAPEILKIIDVRLEPVFS